MKTKFLKKKQKKHVYHDLNLLGHYLAGVWEGDGHIKKNKSSGKTSLHLTMHKQQEPYVKKLLNLLRRLNKNDTIGSVSIRQTNNSCVLNIFSPICLSFMVQLINSKLKTPKAYQLNDVIDWLNKHTNKCFNRLELSSFQKPFILDLNNPWFAGFVDADGSFGIDLSIKTRLKIGCQF